MTSAVDLERDAKAIYDFVRERGFHGGGKAWEDRSDHAKQDWRDAVKALDRHREANVLVAAAAADLSFGA